MSAANPLSREPFFLNPQIDALPAVYRLNAVFASSLCSSNCALTRDFIPYKGDV